MRVAIFGAGGVGGYFGGLLARAGHEVIFIARGAHQQAMKEHGLTVKSPYGDFKLDVIDTTDSIAEVCAVDYLILTVKHYHLMDILPDLKKAALAETTVVPLLNGIDAHEHLIEALGPKNVVGGFCSLVSMIQSPGVILHQSKLRKVVVGELDGRKSARVEALIKAWADIGVDAMQSENILADMWTKFIFIASLGGVSSLARATVGEIRSIPETWQLLIHSMQEIHALAVKQKISVAPDAVQAAMSLIQSLEPSLTSSMQRDVQAGKPFELEAFSGTIVRLGHQLDVPTPANAAIYALLRPALDRSLAGSQP
jgi:2-dehydropantoate 2-reductase